MLRHPAMRPRPFLACLAAIVCLVVSLAAPFARAQSGPAAAPVPEARILILGDSLTAGYGLPDPATQAYPALLQQKIDVLPARPGAPRWRVVNAGVSGDTTSGGLRRIDWVSRQPIAVLVLALGSNDGLRGLSPDLVVKNLAATADRVLAKNPSARVLLVGQRMPTSMGDYAARFDAAFPALATARGWPFVPFLLEGVGGVPELNQADAIHPNEAGHQRMADTVWAGLAPLLANP